MKLPNNWSEEFEITLFKSQITQNVWSGTQAGEKCLIFKIAVCLWSKTNGGPGIIYITFRTTV